MTRRQSNNLWSGDITAHPAPQKFRVQKSARKVFASIFWDQDGIILTDYLPKGQNINAKYYSSVLVQLKGILKEKRQCPGSPALATQKKLASLDFQGLDHPPCSPDLAPSDYHLFPGLKKQLNSCHFSSDAEVIAAAETWLDGQHSEFFLRGLQKLEQRAKKCIELRGEYVE